MGANAAWAAAEELHRAFGARTLVSWGCAAGLTDDVRPGTVVVADRVVGISERAASQDEHAAAQASQWADRVAARLETALPVVRSPIACAGTVLRSGHDKRALAAVTGAAAADMETEAVARFARQIPGPWIAIRVVADDVHTTVPESALAAVDKLGRVDPIAFARALVRTPGDVLQMPAVARAFRRALESLRTARALLGDHLLAPGLPDRTPTASSERV
jgi:adenosylhomocysteine nucleosidase